MMLILEDKPSISPDYVPLFNLKELDLNDSYSNPNLFDSSDYYFSIKNFVRFFDKGIYNFQYQETLNYYTTDILNHILLFDLLDTRINFNIWWMPNSKDILFHMTYLFINDILST